jgi:MscS family membrane protein
VNVKSFFRRLLFLKPSAGRISQTAGILCLAALVLLAGSLRAQQPPAQETDPLARTSPQESMFHFLEACHARDYAKAAHYLDLRSMPAADRAKKGPALAEQLEDLLDDTPFDITALSRDPAGDRFDGLSAGRERLDTFRVGGQNIELQLERVELAPGYNVWLVAADSLPLIPKAHQVVEETALEKRLPQALVTFEILDTPVWRWIALLVIAFALFWLTRPLASGLATVTRPVLKTTALKNPLRVLLLIAGMQLALEFAPPATLSRVFLSRTLTLALVLTLAWTGSILVDVFGERWRGRLDPRVNGLSYSVLPLGRQIIKLCLFLAAILGVASAWGYNTSTVVAGLGVGGLAVALAAQKTIENLFGGISVIGDRPVLVGDTCRFGNQIGTVIHIGLRSTQIRTAERSIISVPNSQFSSMPLENLSRRDKLLLNPTLNLRRDTTSDQLLKVLSSIREILQSSANVESGDIPVRFVGVGPYSLDVEVAVYITTADFDQFVSIRQDLLLRMLRAVEESGTSLAVPLQESRILQQAQGV